MLFTCLCALAGSVVYSHELHQDGFTYTSDHDCTWNRSEMSHGNGGGYSEARVAAKKKNEFINLTCFNPFHRPANHLKVKYKLYKQSGSSWNLCAHTSWTYNNYSTTELTIYTYHGASPVCGNGTYKTLSFGYLKNNNQWRGGSMTSGNVGHALQGNRVLIGCLRVG